MSVPRKYPPAFRPEDWNAMVDAANGMTISGVVVQYLPDFTVRNNGGFYEAIDDHGILTFGGSDWATTNHVDGTKAQDVINAAIVAAGDGVVHCKGDIPCTDKIVITVNANSQFRFEFEKLEFTNDTDGIHVNGTNTYNRFRGYVKGGYLETSAANYSHTALKVSNIVGGRFEIGQIWCMTSTTTGSNGVLCENDAAVATDSALNTFRINLITGYGYGYHITATGGGANTHNAFYDCFITHCYNGVYLYDGGGADGTTAANIFFNVEANAYGWGGTIQDYGFYNQGNGNTYINCRVTDGPSLIYDFYTVNCLGNSRAMLIHCYGVSFGGDPSWFIYYGTGATEGTLAESDVLSAPFAVDSTGLRIFTVAHGLPYPNPDSIQATLVCDAHQDWAATVMQAGFDDTFTYWRVNVTIASASGGETARINVHTKAAAT